MSASVTNSDPIKSPAELPNGSFSTPAQVEDDTPPPPVSILEYKIFFSFIAADAAFLVNVFGNFGLSMALISAGSAACATFVLLSLYEWYRNQKEDPWQMEPQ